MIYYFKFQIKIQKTHNIYITSFLKIVLNISENMDENIYG